MDLKLVTHQGSQAGTEFERKAVAPKSRYTDNSGPKARYLESPMILFRSDSLFRESASSNNAMESI